MDDGERTQLQPRPLRTISRLRVTVVEGPEAGRVYVPERGGVITVGSSPDCGLVLTDPQVSRYHVEVRRAEGGVGVEDLGSRNGTWMGAARLQRAVVPPRTRLTIGASAIVVDDAGAVVDAAEMPAPVPGLIGASEALRDTARLVHRLARVTSSVLIEGETGVGKEVVARAIHEAGPRRDRPFVVVDCGSLPATLIASQLFGHERGAFTGAESRHIGAFERADGGTVLLDEIGELPLELQPALLGVLERRRFCRVGGAAEVAVDVRVLAATNRDLRAEVNGGGFRADLYYRLAIARIVIPPLRDRPEDIELLVVHFVEQITGAPGENPLRHAADALRRHPWSGNVRELRNVVEAALVAGQVNLEGEERTEPEAHGPFAPYREARAGAIARFEREYLRRLMDEARGNASEAARRARMDRPYLLTLLKRHGLR